MNRHFAIPLTIGVLSDTHIYRGGRRALPAELLGLFRRFAVGLIVHAGDVNTAGVLEDLAMVAPVIAVSGNNDDAGVRAIAPSIVEFAAGRFRFAVIHGDGGVSARAEARRRRPGPVDCMIYGHSHIPMIEHEDGAVFFNPGSATDRRWHPHFGLGLIHTTDAGIEPELVLWERPEDLDRIRPDPAAASAPANRA